MVFKLFGFKGSLLGKKKEPKEGKNEVICIGYRVNQEFLDSLPPPVLQSTQPSTSKGGKSTDFSSRLETSKSNGNIPQGVATKNQSDYSNSPKNEVVKERKHVIKPAAKDLFKSNQKGSSSDDKKEKSKSDVAVKEQPKVILAAASNNEPSSTTNAHRDSDNDRKSTLIFLTENHDETEDNRNSNIYEEMDTGRFERPRSPDLEIQTQSRSSTDTDLKINFAQAQRASEDSDGKIEFVQSNRFVPKDYESNPDVYSSQASSLFFGEPEPETIKLTSTKRRAPGRPSEADSETSA